MPNISIDVLDAGKITLPRNQIIFGGGEELVTVPVPAFLIRHPSGDVLFEGGMQPDIKEVLGELPDYTVDYTQENEIPEQIRKAGVDPADLRYAVMSHLHWDHIGAIGHLPGVEFVVHEREWNYAHNSDWFIKFAYPLGQIDRETTKWSFIKSDLDNPQHDLFGDGLISTILVPGHAEGLMAMLVRLDSGPVLLTSDSVVSQLHWDNEALPFYTDAPAAVRSVQMLHDLCEQEGIETVVYGHDLEQFETMERSLT
jgi:N-acyl homoserine lactone hydrolase